MFPEDPPHDQMTGAVIERRHGGSQRIMPAWHQQGPPALNVESELEAKTFPVHEKPSTKIRRQRRNQDAGWHPHVVFGRMYRQHDADRIESLLRYGEHGPYMEEFE